MHIAIAQLAPVPLDRAATLDKAATSIREATASGAKLVAFGETFAPCYPFWLSRTDSARFDAADQKHLHARYLQEAIDIEAGDLVPITEAARETNTAVVIGIAERPADRGSHSVYASCVTIAPDGSVASVHRKLMPTYEERLCWSPGDGNGLRTHTFLPPFTLGSLNCWENWMPLPRAALYAQGLDLHVAIWPGNLVNTQDITRFIARESRSYVISASTILRPLDIPHDFPQRERILDSTETPEDGFIHNGGSCIAAPDGSWLVEPVTYREQIITAEIDHSRVLEERQNFDPAGHYSRPEILKLSLDQSRHTAIEIQQHDDNA